MSVANTARQYIEDHNVDYDVMHHPLTHCSQETAQVMHIKGNKLAKSVILEDDTGYVMAVLPSTHRLNRNALNSITHRDLQLTTEKDLQTLFNDCEVGAVPVTAEAYGMEWVVDKALLEQEEVYFEGGDHEHVFHMKGLDFKKLVNGAKSATISEHR